MLATLNTTTALEALRMHNRITYAWHDHGHGVRLYDCKGTDADIHCKATMTVVFQGSTPDKSISMTLPIVCDWQERAIRRGTGRYHIVDN